MTLILPRLTIVTFFIVFFSNNSFSTNITHNLKYPPPLSTPISLASCDHTKNYDVIIIGAGLAGITAAKELLHLGRSVLVLEATSRIGGRGYVRHLKLPGQHQ